MLEFALAAPVFFLLLFGVVEFGLLLFDNATTRYAASEAARVEAQVGNQATTCNKFTGCVELYGTAKKDMPCDADCQAIIAVHKTALGGFTLEHVNYIEIQQIQTSGSGSFGSFTPVRCQRYNFDGSLYPPPTPLPAPAPAGGCSNYAGSGRGVTTGQMDYIQVNINFTYNWLTAMLRATAPSPVLDSKFVVRLEPQLFAAPAAAAPPPPQPTPSPLPTPTGGCVGDNC